MASLTALLFWRWGNDSAVQPAAAPPESAAARAGSGFFAAAPGALAAAGLWLVGSVLLIAHHALVPVTALHAPWSANGLQVWTLQHPLNRAWAEGEGVWYGGFDTNDVLVSSGEPLENVAFEATTLAPMQVQLQLGRDAVDLTIEPGEAAYVRLTPGPGRRWGDDVFYHLRVVTLGGVAPAALGIADDGRGLGVHLRALQLEQAR